MESGNRSRMRFFLTAVASFVLVLGGVVVGASLWPRVVTVERQVVAPAVDALAARRSTPSLADAVAGACPAVVAVEAAPAPASSAGGKGGETRGAVAAAGFLVSADGYIATLAGVLPDDGAAVRVVLSDGRGFDATRAGADPVSGMALLKIDSSGLPYLRFGDASFARAGESVVAVAAPNGSGCIAGVGTIVADSIAEGGGRRTWLRVRPALDTSFGGAVVLDRDGNVAGIAGLDVPGADDGDDSYLLPASTAQLVSSALLRNGSVTHNAFGIVAEDLSQALADRLGAGRERGAIVSIVEQRSPAARAGLKAGDVVLAAGGSPVSGASELARALDTDAPTLALDILRGSDRLTIDLRNPGAGR